jgi:glycosyltransferase involved in cell wall biosynthesis
MQVLLVARGAAHLPHIARALQMRDALAGLWTSTKIPDGIPPNKFRRAWIFHLAMKPFYALASPRFPERIYHALLPLWLGWVRRQNSPPMDVVHAIMGYGAEPFALAKRVGALKVVDASSSHPTSFFGFWQRECDLFCPGTKVGIPRSLFARANRDLELADLIACPSRFVMESMVYNGIPESKCILNPYGVDTSVFTPRTALPPTPRFICVGAIGLRKGHQYLFRAFEKVRRALPEAELICAGDYHADFKRERPRWEVTFTHHRLLTTRELSSELQKCSAFVLASNEEGFARAIIEAMGSGLPIIATHESGATTLVEHGVQGLIVGSRNVEQLAAAMLRLATEPALNERMGNAAYARGAQNNSWNDYTERLLEFYGNAINRKGPLKAPPDLRVASSNYV